MSFGQSLQIAAGMGRAYPWVLLAVLAATLALSVAVPAERGRIRAAMLMFAGSVVGLILASSLLSYGATTTNQWYRWIRWTSLLLVSIAIVNLASIFAFDVVLGRLGLRPPRIMSDLLLALSYLVVAITLLSRSGVNLAGVVATSAVITAIIGISLQDTLGNIMGGVVLQMEHSIHVGDWIRLDRYEGQVREIRWRQTTIETRDWETVIIPNSVLMKGQVAVLGRRVGAPRQQRRWICFNVDFRYTPSDVIDAVETALRAEPIANVAGDPPPHCFLRDFHDSYAVYAVGYWLTDIALVNPTDSIVRSRIYFALRRATIPLSIPAQSIFVTEDGEERRERKRREEIAGRVAALRQIDLFQTLTDDEMQALAGRLRVAPFARSEAMTRQGAQADCLYIIAEGEAEVRVAAEGSGLSKNVAALHAGDFFGEMGLLTGEPRTATVVARTNVQCYRLDKDAFLEILFRRPQVAEEISYLLARRRAELDAVREGLNEEAMRQRMQSAKGDLLQRIRKFFRLDHAFVNGPNRP